MRSPLLALALSAALTCTMWPSDTSPTEPATLGAVYDDGYVRIVVSVTSCASNNPVIVVHNRRAGVVWRAEDRLSTITREFAEAVKRYRARAVPPGRLHGERELRVEGQLPERQHPGRRVPRVWLAGRQGQARERKPSRTRRRLRTWERA